MISFMIKKMCLSFLNEPKHKKLEPSPQDNWKIVYTLVYFVSIDRGFGFVFKLPLRSSSSC